MTPQFEFDAMLSYSSRDKAAVRALAKRLTAKGLRVWFDEWRIKPGDDIYLTIERGLQVTRCIVLCLSSSAVSSKWVELERSTSLFRDPTNTQRRFIPLLLSDCTIPDTLRRYKRIDYRERSKAAFKELLIAIGPNNTPQSTPPHETSEETREELAGLVRARKSEWKRLRADFESASRKYHDVEMKVFFVTDEGPLSVEQFRQPNHAINLWQFYGLAEDDETSERIRTIRLTNFGPTGAKLNAFGIIIGKQTHLFCKVARRAGTLLPKDVNILIVTELSKRIEKDVKPRKPIFTMNGDGLAKWLNLVLVINSTFLPERFTENVLQVDPFAASLTVFDFLRLDD